MKSRTFPDAKVDARKAKPTVRKNHDEQYCSKKHQENQHLFAHHPVFESGKTKNNVLYRTSASAFDETFSKLDPNDEVHSNRIQQRRKQILMGKNTVGYECYIQRIPKSNRKLRSMDTPSTPDHTLDIPAKRWTGLVKAWRAALHKFDPLDLVTNQFCNDISDYRDGCVATTPVSKRVPTNTEIKDNNKSLLNVSSQELEKRKIEASGSPSSVVTDVSKRSFDKDFSFCQPFEDENNDSDDELL